MENSKALKTIKELQQSIEKNNIANATIVEKLKELRNFALEEQNPVVVKAIRLVYEHIEKNNDFLINIPSDEPIEDNKNIVEVSSTESLLYFLSLLLDLKNKHNISDIKEYNHRLLEF